VKVYIVRATEGIGVIYGVFDSRDRAAQYASTAAVAIEEYEVSQAVERAKTWIPWTEEAQERHDLVMHGGRACSCSPDTQSGSSK
jgi:hypothetical protein